MDESLYDEFGNYIGPELAGSEEVRAFKLCKVCLNLHTIAVVSRSACVKAVCLPVPSTSPED